jgi:hypothetical protein
MSNGVNGSASVQPATVRDFLNERARAIYRCTWAMVIGVVMIVGALALLGDILEEWGDIVAAIVCLSGFAVYTVAISRAFRDFTCPYCGTRLGQFDLLWPSHSWSRRGERFGRTSVKIRYLPCCRGLIDAELPTAEDHDDRT